MSNWRVVTGDDGKPYLEIDNVKVAAPQEPGGGQMFLAVTPPGGVANIPVGSKAPAWLQGMIENAAQFAKDATMIALMPPQQGATVNPLTDTSRWNIDAVQALRDSSWRGRGYTDYAKANPSYPRRNGKAALAAARGATADHVVYDEVVNMQGDVVRRDPVEATDDQPVTGDGLFDAFEAARAAMASFSNVMGVPNPLLPGDPTRPPGNPLMPASPQMSPNQDGLSVTVRRWLPGDDQLQAAKAYGRVGTLGGFPIVTSPNVPAGGMFIGNPGIMPAGVIPAWTVTGDSWTVTDTNPEPEPEPEQGRFQNLDWE